MVGFHVRQLWDREESAHTSTKSKNLKWDLKPALL